MAWLFASLLLSVLLGVPRAYAVDELDFGLEQHTLRKIQFLGNRTFSDDQLKAMLKIKEPSWLHPLRAARYQPDLIEAELRLITRFYRQRGFHQVRVTLFSIVPALSGGGDIVTIAIDEGPRTYVDRLVFAGEGPLSADQLHAGLLYVDGVPLPADLNDLGRDLHTLRSRYWDLGYLNVQIVPQMATVPTEDPARHSGMLTYTITPGQLYRLGRIEITGNRLTQTRLIERELTLSEGDPIRWSAVSDSQRRLFATALFRDVILSPVGFDTVAGTAGLAVRVVERRPAYYEIGMGVGSRERLRVLGAWGHNNLWGSGQRLQLRSRAYLNYDLIQPTTRDRATPQVNYRFDVLHTHPHFLRERLRLDSNVYLEKETRGESGLNLGTRGFSLGTQFPGRRGMLNIVSLQVESARPTLHPDASDSLIAVFESKGIRESQTHSVNHGLYLEGRDNIFHPTRGKTANVQTEIAGGFLGGDNSFAKVGASWHAYVKPPLGGVVAMRTSVGAVRAFGDSRARGADGVPYQERFFAGGVSSVRGYLEGSLGPQLPSSQRDSLQLTSPDVPLSDRPARGGNYLLLTNVEWRFPLPLLSRWKLSGVLFADGGNVWERMDDIRLRSFRWRSAPRAPEDSRATKLWDYRYSVGTGLRLDTPFGPFRLDVGFPLKRARLSETASEDKVLVHFSLGYPF